MRGVARAGRREGPLLHGALRPPPDARRGLTRAGAGVGVCARAGLAEVTPSIHYTMGGVRINAAGEVLGETADDTYKPIHGLFGAGEVTGGVHGGNRLAGNSLLECAVFGRVAGRRAAANVVDGENACGACLPGRGCALRGVRVRMRVEHACGVVRAASCCGVWSESGRACGRRGRAG